MDRAKFCFRRSVRQETNLKNKTKDDIWYFLISQTWDHDHLTIYDGSNDQSTQIAKLSGNLGTFSISSIGNSLFVKFETSLFFAYAGFLATIHYGNSYLNIHKTIISKYFILKVKFNYNTTLSLVDCATVSNGQPGFCGCNTCFENEGYCDNHHHCQDGLLCGSNNCPASLGFHSEVDCCYQPTLGDEDFCTTAITCGENEGDCDSNIECQSNHFCGSNNCPASLDFNSEIDCCSSTQIMSPNYPNSYPNNAEDTWMIIAPTGLIITLQFHSFHVRFIIESKHKTR